MTTDATDVINYLVDRDLVIQPRHLEAWVDFSSWSHLPLGWLPLTKALHLGVIRPRGPNPATTGIVLMLVLAFSPRFAYFASFSLASLMATEAVDLAHPTVFATDVTE